MWQLEAGVRWEQGQPASKRNQGFPSEGFKGTCALPPSGKSKTRKSFWPQYSEQESQVKDNHRQMPQKNEVFCLRQWDEEKEHDNREKRR